MPVASLAEVRRSPLPLVLAVAVPFLFLHPRYQPFDLRLPISSRDVTINATDLAVLAVAVAALAGARTYGFRARRVGLAVWLAAAALVAMIYAATLHPLLTLESYDWLAHFVTATKFAEYAVLALAVPLVVRRVDDLVVLPAALVLWSAVATSWGFLQFLGLVDEFEGRRPGQREPSFVGIHDFSALSAAALAVALAAIALRSDARGRALLVVAGIAGVAGVILAASVAGVLGTVLAGGAAALVARRRRVLTARRAAALAALCATTVFGVLAFRAADFDQFLRFVGVRPAEAETVEDVQSYSHRSVLAYIGVRIFADHPVVGAGWQASSKEEEVYGRYVDDARARFPDVPEQAFPSPARPWGTQNAYLQALADLGVLGLGVFVALFVAGIVVAGRVALRAPPALAQHALVAVLFLFVAVGAWNAQGLVAGLALDALTWLALGLAVAAAAIMNRERA